MSKEVTRYDLRVTDDGAGLYATDEPNTRGMQYVSALDYEALLAERDELRKDAECVGDLSALVRQLVHKLSKAEPGSDLPERAMDYLKRKGLQGSPLRCRSGGAIEDEAKRIYEQWADHRGYVPWVEGGNSLKQEDARRLAHAALQGEQP